MCEKNKKNVPGISWYIVLLAAEDRSGTILAKTFSEGCPPPPSPKVGQNDILVFEIHAEYI